MRKALEQLAQQGIVRIVVVARGSLVGVAAAVVGHILAVAVHILDCMMADLVALVHTFVESIPVGCCTGVPCTEVVPAG